MKNFLRSHQTKETSKFNFQFSKNHEIICYPFYCYFFTKKFFKYNENWNWNLEKFVWNLLNSQRKTHFLVINKLYSKQKHLSAFFSTLNIQFTIKNFRQIFLLEDKWKNKEWILNISVFLQFFFKKIDFNYD